VWKSANRAGPVRDASPAGEHGFGPRTNGKAEAMVKILLNGCAYARSFRRDDERSADLPRFTDLYNRADVHTGV